MLPYTKFANKKYILSKDNKKSKLLREISDYNQIIYKDDDMEITTGINLSGINYMIVKTYTSSKNIRYSRIYLDKYDYVDCDIRNYILSNNEIDKLINILHNDDIFGDIWKDLLYTNNSMRLQYDYDNEYYGLKPLSYNKIHHIDEDSPIPDYSKLKNYKEYCFNAHYNFNNDEKYFIKDKIFKEYGISTYYNYSPFYLEASELLNEVMENDILIDWDCDLTGKKPAIIIITTGFNYVGEKYIKVYSLNLENIDPDNLDNYPKMPSYEISRIYIDKPEYVECEIRNHILSNEEIDSLIELLDHNRDEIANYTNIALTGDQIIQDIYFAGFSDNHHEYLKRGYIGLYQENEFELPDYNLLKGYKDQIMIIDEERNKAEG